MFRIGEFSKIAQVPGSLLRYYDRIGLFKPDHIDEWTGYRYYSTRQLPRLHRILALKELGLTLDQVAQLVDDEVSTEELRGMLTLKKAQVEQSLREEVARLRHIEARLQQIEAVGQSRFDIVLKEVPAQYYLSLRKTLPDTNAGINAMQQLIQTIPPRVGSEKLGHFTAVLHSESLENDEIDLEVGVILHEVHDPLNLSGERLTVRLLPAVALMATVVRVGGFETSCQSYGNIGVWIEENGYRIAGPGREVLIQPPRRQSLDDMVTEIQFPVKHAGNPLLT